MRQPTAKDFLHALAQLKRPPTNGQRAFLEAHLQAPARAMTASKLARSAGFKSFRGVNLSYGGLAREISRALESGGHGLDLLVEFVRPASVTNRHWILVMRPAFASALKRSSWLNRNSP